VATSNGCTLDIQINIPPITINPIPDLGAAGAALLQGAEASGLVTGLSFDSSSDLFNATLSSSGFADLAQWGTLSFTSATAGTIAIGGSSIGWSITNLGQFILTGANFLGVVILSQVLVQPAGGKDELCYSQYEEDVQVCIALTG
jgi:hypothetical protein